MLRLQQVAIAAMIGLTAANPLPQDIDFDLAYALPEPTYITTMTSVAYNPSAILESALSQITSTVEAQTATTTAVIAKRDAACQPVPTGSANGPTILPDTVDDFAASKDLASSALSATIPGGYTRMFSNLNASNKYVDSHATSEDSCAHYYLPAVPMAIWDTKSSRVTMSKAVQTAARSSTAA